MSRLVISTGQCIREDVEMKKFIYLLGLIFSLNAIPAWADGVFKIAAADNQPSGFGTEASALVVVEVYRISVPAEKARASMKDIRQALGLVQTFRALPAGTTSITAATKEEFWKGRNMRERVFINMIRNQGYDIDKVAEDVTPFNTLPVQMSDNNKGKIDSSEMAFNFNAQAFKAEDKSVKITFNASTKPFSESDQFFSKQYMLKLKNVETGYAFDKPKESSKLGDRNIFVFSITPFLMDSFVYPVQEK